MSLPTLVSDWDGFEGLVAELHREANVTVERNVILQGKSGAPREVDVLVTSRTRLHVHRTICECKFWNSKIKRKDVDVVAAYMDDLNVQGAVMFTTVGYQSGAKTYAEYKGIKIYKVREIEDDEYGRPGRFIELYLHIWDRTFGPKMQLAMHGRHPVIQPKFGVEVTTTPLLGREESLEQLIVDRTLRMMTQVKEENAPRIFCNGSDCFIYQTTPFQINFATPVRLSPDACLLSIGGTLGIRISQSFFRYDRKDSALYAVVVEDCISKSRTLVSKTKTEDYPYAMSLDERKEPDEGVLRNGSIISVVGIDLILDPEFSDMWDGVHRSKIVLRKDKKGEV